MQEPVMRAAIYARISETDEQVDKVDRQRAICREFAAKQGYKVVAEFEDDGISAFKRKVRPGYDRLLQGVEQRDFDVIVATFQNRLSRDWFATAQLIKA